MADEFTRAVVEALATSVNTNVTGLAAVYRDWPDKNIELAYPSISVLPGAPQFTRCQPYLYSQGAVASGEHTAATKYVVGQYELPIQLDVWCKYKAQRATILDLVMAMLNPTLAKGYVLRLTAYHDVWVNITTRGYKWLDSMNASALQEWRAIVELELTCLAIRSTTDYIITEEPVLTFTTPDRIELDE